MSQLTLRFVIAAAFAAIAWIAPTTSQACGGLWCSATAPVNQAAERIVFAKHDDGTVTAIVQIQYEGPSEDFAWMLPVPGVPDVSVSSDQAFQRLQNASNPVYNLTTDVEGNCRERSFGDSASAGGGAGGAGGSGGGGGSGPPVNVLAEGTVGPFDFVVIQPNPALDNLGDVAVEWLTDEGYDVVPPGGNPDDISALLGSYLEDEMNLLAFRLTKGNDTGSIRPIWIRYESARPMIPIRPTAVAANPDMGVMVWVLGETRAVPANYKALELNEALVDWFTGGQNYNDVVIAAANEAGGQGFVTEQAGGSEFYDQIVFGENDQRNWDNVRAAADTGTPRDAIVQASNLYGNWDGYRDAIAAILPSSVDVNEFLTCPSCNGALTFNGVDVDSFLDDVEESVIAPMRDTQELIDGFNYVSRLYTTMSAPEMDLDPEFDFNPDLNEVTNQHNARRVIECSPAVFFNEAPSRVELEDGRVIRISAGTNTWPFNVGDDSGLPANSRVLELGTSGEGEVVTDNAGMIAATLNAHNATVPGPPGQLGGGACSAGHSVRNAAAGWALLFLAILLWTVPRRLRRG